MEIKNKIRGEMCVAWAGWPLSLSAAVDRIWTGLYKERNERERDTGSARVAHTRHFLILSCPFCFYFILRFDF